MTNLLTVLSALRELAPENSALPNDPIGLLVGSETDSEVTKIGVCLDATYEAATHAAREGAQLLIAHHPLIYRPLKRIDADRDPIARSVKTLIKADISLYAMHTNWDRAALGINDTFAKLLKLEKITSLGHEDIAALVRLGNLPKPMPLSEFATFVADTLGCLGTSALRMNAIDPTRLISRVAVCGGAGAELAAQVLAAGADVYVTSDVHHHEFLDATARDLPLLDAGHSATETPGMRTLVTLLASQFPDVSVIWCGD